MIQQLAVEVGLNTVSAISASDIRTRLEEDRLRLEQWQQAGFASEMAYMNRDSTLFVELERFLPGVRTLLSFSIPYRHRRVSDAIPPLHGRVARYAWGEDYHIVIRNRLELFAKRLQEEWGKSLRFRIFTDAVPVLERALARLGKLGFIGKNTLLIRPGSGSYAFLAEILLDVETEPSRQPHWPPSRETGGCKSCFRCGTACPTGAIREPYSVDSSRCISYLTIEKRTLFTEWEEKAIGGWVFGCDICQEVCPFNHRGIQDNGALPEFAPERGVGGALPLREVLNIRDDREYRHKFKGTALLRAKRAQLLRNACSVAANLGYKDLCEDLFDAARTDSSDIVRISAQRALKRLEE